MAKQLLISFACHFGHDGHRSLVFQSIIIVAHGCTDKDAVPILPDLQRRASTYSAGSTLDEVLVNDFYLNSGWYSVRSYTMATDSPVPEVGTCGTDNPIYIRGDAPEKSTIPNNTEVEFGACLRSIFDICDVPYTIKIRNCSGELQYFLEYTERFSAYCFSPAGTPTNVSLGEITVEPELQFDKGLSAESGIKYNPFLEFECKFNQQPEYFYSVKWYSNDKLIESLGPSQNMSYLSLKEKENSNLTLGVNIQCGVSVSADEDGLQTATEFSAKYFAGIKFNNLTVWLSETLKVSVTFKITVPIGCRYAEKGYNDCNYDLRMFERADNCSNLVSQSRCGVTIQALKEGETWDPDKEYSISILTRYESYADVKAFVLNFRTQRSGHGIWRDHQPESVDVIVTDNEVYKRKYCYSHVDPHMRTSDGELYEHQQLGTYVLYRNNEYNIEVQEQTHSCNHRIATCTCGVVIRAGADVLMFNTCGRLNFIEFKECNEGGILRTKRINNYLYRVHTPIGTYIEILLLKKPYNGSMNVNVYMSPKDYNNIVGLCGVFDGNKSNDFTTFGGEVRPSNRDYVFSESWKLNSTDPNNMFRINYTSPKTWSQENALFCYCNNSNNQTLAETTCSAREGCIVTDSKDVTKRLFTVVLERKRRSISKRFALDTGTTHSKLTKRSDVIITDDEANTTCTNVIGSALVSTDFTELLAPGEVEAKIEQCIYDVLDLGDLGAATVHVDALNAIATFHMDIDPEYVANNTDKVALFKQQSCLSNCSSQGTCVDGECQCVDHFHGADCSIDERTPLIIDGVTDDGVCDIMTSDCHCFHVQTDNLIETFKFQYIKSEQGDGKTYSLVESFSGNGEYLSLFEGIVCFDSPTNQQAFVTHYNLSISNDGITYSDPVEIYVYDSTCQQYTTNANGRYNFNVMNGHCFISGVCYDENDKSQDNACNVCLPTHDTTNWTSACSTDKEVEGKSFLIIIAAVVGGIAAVAVVGIFVYCVKKSKMRISSNCDGNKHTADMYVRSQSAMSTRSQTEIFVKFTTTPRDTVNGDTSANEHFQSMEIQDKAWMDT